MAIERNWRKRINRDPGILRGSPVITGTRVPIEIVLGSLASGMSTDEVCEGYRLTESDIQAALAYATDLVARQKRRPIPPKSG